ncbi:MAG: hypothetical protein AAF802_01275 [Planctomycetota bacterium]
MNTCITIDELILDGITIDRSQSRLLKAAIKEELAHLLGENRLDIDSSRSVKAISSHDMSLPAGSDVKTLGKRIAHSVHGVLSNAP